MMLARKRGKGVVWRKPHRTAAWVRGFVKPEDDPLGIGYITLARRPLLIRVPSWTCRMVGSLRS